MCRLGRHPGVVIEPPVPDPKNNGSSNIIFPHYSNKSVFLMNKPTSNDTAKAASVRIRAANRARASASSASSTANQPLTTRRIDQLERALNNLRNPTKMEQRVNTAFPQMSREQRDIARVVLDPVHLVQDGPMAPLIPDPSSPGRAVGLVQVTDFTINIPAGESAVMSSIPSFEAPARIVLSDALPHYAMSNSLTKSSIAPGNWLHDQGIYSFRTTGKSITVTNVTAAINRAGTIAAVRMNPSIDVRNAAIAGTTTRTDNFNQRILQAYPSAYAEVTGIAGSSIFTAEEGLYAVHRLNDRLWRHRDNGYNKCIELATAPLATDTNCGLYDTDISAPAGVPQLLQWYNQSGLPAGSSALVGQMDATDVIHVAMTAASTAQTYQIKIVCVYEFLPKASSSNMLAMRRMRSTEYDFMELVYKFASTELDMHPADWNDLGGLWDKFKSFLGKAVGFYKDNSKILRPALSLIPGVGSALAIADQYI